MIFYHPDCDHRFTDYGIGIPIVVDRARKVFDQLKINYPKLSYTDLSKSYFFQKEDLLRVHDEEFVNHLFGSEEEVKKEIFKSYELFNQKTGEFNRYDPNLQEKSFFHLRDIILSQGSMTYNSTLSSLESGFSFHLGGGMHHAMSFGGRGFCLYNDLVVTLKKLKHDKKINTAWIIDVDVHKGDGAAELLKNDSWAKTLSIHMKEGWPLDDENKNAPWFIPSTIDVEIDLNEEHLYLEKLESALLELDKNSPHPDVVIVVNGADPFEADELASAALIKLSKAEMFQRDMLVYNFLKERKIPQSYVMAGGYGSRSWEIWYQFLNHVLKENSK